MGTRRRSSGKSRVCADQTGKGWRFWGLGCWSCRSYCVHDTRGRKWSSPLLPSPSHSHAVSFLSSLSLPSLITFAAVLIRRKPAIGRSEVEPSPPSMRCNRLSDPQASPPRNTPAKLSSPPSIIARLSHSDITTSPDRHLMPQPRRLSRHAARECSLPSQPPPRSHPQPHPLPHTSVPF